MLKFLQDEFIGLRSRWPRLLALLTCLCMALVMAQQERAIEVQGSLIRALSGDSNRAKLETEKQPRVSIYITDSHILEPASKPPQGSAPDATKPTSPARFQKTI